MDNKYFAIQVLRHKMEQISRQREKIEYSIDDDLTATHAINRHEDLMDKWRSLEAAIELLFELLNKGY